MGFPSEMRDAWTRRRESLLISSPQEDRYLSARRCQEEGVRAGFKWAAIACVTATISTLIGVRVIPWAKANLNTTAQALIISAASFSGYYIAADKTILECARNQTLAEFQKAVQLHGSGK